MTILSKDIVKDWGISSLHESEQTSAVNRIGKLIYQAVLVRSLDILSEKEETELDLLLDEDNTTPEDVLTFLQSKIPTFDQLVLEERAKLKEDFSVSIT